MHISEPNCFMELDNEQQQIEDAKTNPGCFEPLYTKYYARILKFVYKRIESLDESRDVTAMVFTKALCNISQYRYQGFPFSSWLYRIAINEINLFYRRTKKARIISLDEKSIKNIANEADGVDGELVKALRQSLLYLSEDELLLLELRFFEERPFSQVAQILDITENNAKVKTYRVLDKLRKVYTQIA